jgi:hypothetical protein
LGTSKKQKLADQNLVLQFAEGLLAQRALLFEQMEEKLIAPDLSKVENFDLIVLVCECWFAVLDKIVRVIDKPEENWHTILARGNSLIENLNPHIFACLSFGMFNPDDLLRIVVQWFRWKCCYNELVKRINQQDHCLKCDSCDFKATGIIELRKHFERTHARLFSAVKKFVGKLKRCKYCPLKVPNVTEHMRESHPEALEWLQKQESAKKTKELVFPPRAGKAFALSLWKDEELNKAVVYGLLAHIWTRREKVHETIKRQRDLRPDVLYPGTKEKAWNDYLKVAAQYEGRVDVPAWPHPLPNERAALWGAVIEWLYLDSVRQMLGIYGPVLDAKLEDAFDEDIINSTFSPVRPIQGKMISYLKEVSKNGQPDLVELKDVRQEIVETWVKELQSIRDDQLEKLFSAARNDPNPKALFIVQDLLRGDTHETIMKRHNLDRKTIHNVLTRVKTRCQTHLSS